MSLVASPDRSLEGSARGPEVLVAVVDQALAQDRVKRVLGCRALLHEEPAVRDHLPESQVARSGMRISGMNPARNSCARIRASTLSVLMRA